MALKLTSLALALGLAASFAAPAYAAPETKAPETKAPETKRGNETIKKYCTGDYLNYCGNLAPEDPKLEACFEKNWKSLSENCRRAIDAYEATQGNKKKG